LYKWIKTIPFANWKEIKQIIMPVHVNTNHWVLFVVQVTKRIINIADHLGLTDAKYCEKKRNYCHELIKFLNYARGNVLPHQLPLSHSLSLSLSPFIQSLYIHSLIFLTHNNTHPPPPNRPRIRHPHHATQHYHTTPLYLFTNLEEEEKYTVTVVKFNAVMQQYNGVDCGVHVLNDLKQWIFLDSIGISY
jgi:hypothetical protein